MYVSVACNEDSTKEMMSAGRTWLRSGMFVTRPMLSPRNLSRIIAALRSQGNSPDQRRDLRAVGLQAERPRMRIIHLGAVDRLYRDHRPQAGAHPIRNVQGSPFTLPESLQAQCIHDFSNRYSILNNSRWYSVYRTSEQAGSDSAV